MLYHQSGFISRQGYDQIKKIVRTLVVQETERRNLLPDRGTYEHETTDVAGEIWVADFTRLTMEGTIFYAAVVMDAASVYYLGVATSRTCSDALVETPVLQAPEASGNQSPQKFLLTDNGNKYIIAKHSFFPSANKIVHKFIPSCRPEFNGSAECGIKEFKNVFYNQWAKKKSSADKEKNVDELVQETVTEKVRLLNERIPRLSLGGITPKDVLNGHESEKRTAVQTYKEEQKEREPARPVRPGRELWKVVKNSLDLSNICNEELIIKFYYFCRRTLRVIAKSMKSGVG